MATPAPHRHTSAPAAWSAPDIGAAVLQAATLDRFAFRPHTHARLCLALTVHGRARIRVERDWFDLRKGDLMVIPPAAVHEGGNSAESGWRLRSLHVDRELFDALAERYAAARGAGPVSPRKLESPAAARLFHGLHRCSQEGGSALRRSEALAGLVGVLARAFGDEDARPRRRNGTAGAARIRDLIEGRLFDAVTLDELGQAVDLPGYEVVRRFRAAYGMPPHAYQLQRRIAAACAAMDERTPLADLAADCGFADQAHFTRTFKAVMGVSPAVYRRGVMSTSV